MPSLGVVVCRTVVVIPDTPESLSVLPSFVNCSLFSIPISFVKDFFIPKFFSMEGSLAEEI